MRALVMYSMVLVPPMMPGLTAQRILETASKKLYTIAADDLPALTTPAPTVSQICADCHARYRTRK